MKACVTGKMRVFVTDLFWFLFLSMVGIDEEILRFIFGKKNHKQLQKACHVFLTNVSGLG